MIKKITPKLVKQIIDEWESISDTDQHRDCIATKKEENVLYKQIADNLNNLIAERRDKENGIKNKTR
jgi:hypothetical protein